MEEIRDRILKIEDPQHPSYVKYALVDILIIIMCGVLCGLDTLENLAVYAKSAADFLRETFGEDVRLFFEDGISRTEWESCKTTEKNAGRIEKRICRKATDISWLSDQKWPGLRSVFAIERIVEDHGHCSIVARRRAITFPAEMLPRVN